MPSIIPPFFGNSPLTPQSRYLQSLRVKVHKSATFVFMVYNLKVSIHPLHCKARLYLNHSRKLQQGYSIVLHSPPFAAWMVVLLCTSANRALLPPPMEGNIVGQREPLHTLARSRGPAHSACTRYKEWPLRSRRRTTFWCPLPHPILALALRPVPLWVVGLVPRRNLPYLR